MPAWAAGNAPSGHSTKYTKPFNLVDCGATPGVLDPNQKSRVLRDANAFLHFSTFDPLTASGLDAVISLRRLSLSAVQEKRHPPKRIVVEVSGSGKSSWRFVPRALTEDGVEDEGLWPRIVDVCGKPVLCCQDQWDIYKLDPYYDCTVALLPALSTIRPAPPRPKTESSPLKKRAHENDETSGNIPNKRFHRDVTMESVLSNGHENTDDEDDEVLVAEMVTSEHPYRNPIPATTSTRPKQPSRTPKPRPVPTTPEPEPVSQAAGLSNPVNYQEARQSHSVPPESQRKRKELFETNLNTPLEEDEEEVIEPVPKRRRPNHAPAMGMRTPSDPSGQRALRAKKREREELKRKKYERDQAVRREEREKALLEELMSTVPHPPPSSHFPPAGPGIDRDSSMRGFSDYEDGDMNNDRSTAFGSAEEAARAVLVEESRRKMRDLEADRPLWERTARERKAQQEAANRARLDAKRQQEEEGARKERERLRQEQLEAEAQLKREEMRMADERSQRAKERQARRDRWTSGRWTNARAVQRYNETSDLFDMSRFSEASPLSIDDVPWPTLRHPNAFSLPEDVDWESVEQFFEVLKHHMRTQDYIIVVQKSLHRFHPDRWKGRGLFRSIANAEEREYMDVAVNTVSQALAPIWTKVKGMKQA